MNNAMEGIGSHIYPAKERNQHIPTNIAQNRMDVKENCDSATVGFRDSSRERSRQSIPNERKAAAVAMLLPR